MNHIATVKYSSDPISGRAYLYLKSPSLGELYKKLGFDTRNYSRESQDLFEDFSAYLVRGIRIDNFYIFERHGNQHRIYTQKCANNHILVTDEEGRAAVNISHIRGTQIGKGFTYRVHPLNPTKAKQIMLSYSEGVIEYYNCLKDHVTLQEKWNKNLDK